MVSTVTTIGRALLLYTLAAACLVLAAPAHAVSLDRALAQFERGRRVYDLADKLSPAEERELYRRLARMEQAGYAEGVVVVLDQMEGSTIEEYGLAFIERWKVGRKGVDNGFALVVSIGDRRSRFESGYQVEGVLPDVEANRILQDTLRPEFRRQRYGAGLVAALDAVDRRLRENRDELPAPAAGSRSILPALSFLLALATAILSFFAWPRGAETSTDRTRGLTGALGVASLGAAVMIPGGPAAGPILTALPAAALGGFRLMEARWLPVGLPQAREFSQRLSSGYVFLALGVGVIGLFLGAGGWVFAYGLVAVLSGMALKGYARRAPRRCPECSGALRWLPEEQEAGILKAGENAEQALGSVDYDVWHCGKCSRSAVVPQPKFQPGAAACPKCHRKTLTHRTLLDEAPTLWAAGWASEVKECQNPDCDYREEERRELQRGGYRDDGLGGIIILPAILGGWGGGWGDGGGYHGSGGGSGDGGWSGGGDLGDFGGIDVGDFGGGGGAGGGGASGDW
jgi:uncharacterized protein